MVNTDDNEKRPEIATDNLVLFIIAFLIVTNQPELDHLNSEQNDAGPSASVKKTKSNGTY